MKIAAAMPENATMRIKISGADFDDAEKNNNTTIILKLGPKADGEARFTKAGLQVMEEEGKVIVDALTWDSKHKQLDNIFSLGDLDNPVKVESVLLERDRLPKEVFYIPALLLLGLIVFLQRRRHEKLEDEEASQAASA